MFRQLTSIAALICCLLGCKNIDKRDSSKEEGVTRLIDENFVYLERTDGRTAALLRFRTTAPAFCAYTYWPSDRADDEQSQPVPCGATDPHTEFSEVLKGLEPNQDYSVRIFAWHNGQTIDSADQFLIHEDALPIDDHDLFVARYDNTLRFAEVHRHRLSSVFDPAQVSQKLKKDVNCTNDIPSGSAFYSEATNVVRLTSLATQGFGLGQSDRHPLYSSRFVIPFSILQEGDDWEWLFGLNGVGYRFIAREPTRFAALSISDESGFWTPIEDTQLSVAANTYVLTEGSSLKLQWAATPILPTSYMIVQFGHPGGAGVFCVFPANIGLGEVPWNVLSALPKKVHDVQYSLYSAQLFNRAREGSVPWLIVAHDWKVGRVQIQ